MSDVIRLRQDGRGALLPVACKLTGGVSTRFATQDDFAWIDALQKQNSRCVGFRREVEIRKRIETRDILVAEVDGTADFTDGADQAGELLKSLSSAQSVVHAGSVPAGYCMGVDKYMQQGHVGIIYQMCVSRTFRRSLVAATLLQARLDTSAYGTTLYSCWCRQDLEANRFWEAMGFVPVAFRAAGRSTVERLEKKGGAKGGRSGVSGGSRASGAVHIFWQKRVRAGDTRTAWWYPYETRGGAMMEGRVCLPIPPGVHWSAVMPAVLPGDEQRERALKALEDEAKAATQTATRLARGAKPAKSSKPGASKSASGGVVRPAKRRAGPVSAGGFGVGVKVGGVLGETDATADAQRAAAEHAERRATEAEALIAREGAEAAKAKLKAARRANDPALVAHARELRDKWQEHVAANPAMLEDKAAGKYDVSRALGVGGADASLCSAGGLRGVDQPKRLAA
ncbi:MAG: hypothetical protein AAF916_02655 [Planctomycetota bacterium]